MQRKQLSEDEQYIRDVDLAAIQGNLAALKKLLKNPKHTLLFNDDLFIMGVFSNAVLYQRLDIIKHLMTYQDVKKAVQDGAGWRLAVEYADREIFDYLTSSLPPPSSSKEEKMTREQRLNLKLALDAAITLKKQDIVHSLLAYQFMIKELDSDTLIAAIKSGELQTVTKFMMYPHVAKELSWDHIPYAIPYIDIFDYILKNINRKNITLEQLFLFLIEITDRIQEQPFIITPDDLNNEDLEEQAREYRNRYFLVLRRLLADAAIRRAIISLEVCPDVLRDALR